MLHNEVNKKENKHDLIIAETKSQLLDAQFKETLKNAEI